ncbi:hypothetical protein PT974_02056 [Cladobotryum mycophilum]|uniref:N-acetyltransferase domain-containing protein n=1 Tax=Cladobotryum mycophilum TaxID=491253 RepID=A0ABR0SX16_9HYPO
MGLLSDGRSQQLLPLGKGPGSLLSARSTHNSPSSKIFSSCRRFVLDATAIDLPGINYEYLSKQWPGLGAYHHSHHRRGRHRAASLVPAQTPPAVRQRRSLILVHRLLRPLSDHAAISYWLELLPSVIGAQPTTVLLIATHPEVPGVLATAQLGLMPKETHSYKGEIRKLLVHPTYRRHGFGKLMMAELERLAREDLALDLLVLDTAKETPAREFYVRTGWTEWGVCPDYAKSADGKKHACCFFVKRLE